MEITDTSGVITWQEPANKNGLLTTYAIVVTTLGPDYEIPEGCDISDEREIYTAKIDAANTEYFFTEGLPYYKYSVVIEASTRQGNGSASETVQFRTSEGGECLVSETIKHSLNEAQLMRRETATVVTLSDYKIIISRTCKFGIGTWLC